MIKSKLIKYYLKVIKLYLKLFLGAIFACVFIYGQYKLRCWLRDWGCSDISDREFIYCEIVLVGIGVLVAICWEIHYYYKTHKKHNTTDYRE
jgi:hypothetical protein